MKYDLPPSCTPIQLIKSDGIPIGGPIEFRPVSGGSRTFRVFDCQKGEMRPGKPLRLEKFSGAGFHMIEEEKATLGAFPQDRALNRFAWTWELVE